MKKTVLLLSASLLQAAAFANVRLPNIFGDNMVLQRDKPIPVWGWADKNEKVTVQFNNQTKTVKADKNGQWKVELAPVAAGSGSYTLTVKGNNSITLHDIVMGDVWICSGQSNMEWPVSRVFNATNEIAQSANPNIRHFYLPKDVSATPKDDVKPSAWKPASPDNTGEFTAVGYFFAKALNEQLHVPIGLVHTSWGGTMVETWISREGMANSSTFSELMKRTPVLNLDSLNGAIRDKLIRKITTLQGKLPDATTAAAFKDAGLNDQSWPKMSLPGYWETKQLKDFDGVVWYRKTVNIPAEDAGKGATLSLGAIDDNDVTYINGVQVGSTNDYSAQRVYKVPAGILKAGENVIAIKVTDNAGNGGVYGQKDDLFLEINGRKQPLAGEWGFQVAAVSPGASSLGPNSYPCLLYNAMIHPILQLGIKGAIWYQGETNAGRAYEYRQSFPLMIQDWRKLWKQGDFPFYFVQLASFNASNGNSKVGSSWAELREAQTLTLQLPNTGMAVITDIGEPTDIHPRNKQDVGKRLAAIALNDTYKMAQVSAGPTYQSMAVNGNKVTITYTNVGGGLKVNDKYGYIRGFEVAGADQQFHYAKAYLDGNKVVVYSDEVASPVAVRFGWADNNLEDNLFNQEGFPAAPFRTDNWKGITETNKFAVQL
ncbi:sialate O-acetylesterase [Chitinophaga terrae (ex Kim and Jung 2007)]|uniref:Sialate O-acetylesterase n=1 Tax=Chitinophaga terrae (ex Kim and Jung 2007) TaxID=408074 RepID=A0A1H3ZDH8_9BACT|nr:sialate O-acetylesterase [Chitinophaga terrae (ex Kim and Jung 2007)]MDQ0109206.1 sialate O-acetylesterase [Chitinophaga terrae (ex Kim and Jung 2007)]GEP88696.1 9-O-acetylesterase [Chitinophaga terrae (ex Kim and Jung 2007)]SEA21675.1 sialate O-acetylesterase [Chitinophaga terrae (ex Kim and Jung 2007)]